MKDQRSTINSVNLDELLAASTSAKAATLAGQQQYSTPPEWARLFTELLPSREPAAALDPQCAGGNLLLNGFRWGTELYGVDIDKRFEDDNTVPNRIVGNSVLFWELAEDAFPDLRWPCQVANPPFGIGWKTPAGTADSTEYTWRKILAHAAPSGFGFFIANAKTIERLGLEQHPWVYLYQKFPAGFFPRTAVEPGVVHWFNGPHPERTEIVQSSLDPARVRTGAGLCAWMKHWQEHPVETDWEARTALKAAWADLELMMAEESRPQSPFNVWLDRSGLLHIYLSTRTQVNRKLTRDQVLQLTRIDECHPLTLTTETESRKVLRDLLDCGFYTIEPGARAAIEAALAEVAKLATPIMPVTDFEKVAYADEMEALTVRADFQPADARFAFTPGRAYPLRTATYTFSEKFTRTKQHFDEETGETRSDVHTCELTGQDRYIAVIDDAGDEHRFMDKPRDLTGRGAKHLEHAETLLWKIFTQPTIRTIAESHADQVQETRRRLEAMAQQLNQ